MPDILIDIISATRYSESLFWEKSALGRSLRRFSCDPRLTSHISYENRRGLPEIYNQAIHSDTPADIILFVHDDVWLDDVFWIERLLVACENYDIVGLAGNTRRTNMQPAWCFVWSSSQEGAFCLDEFDNLSGSIAHGANPGGKITKLGPSGVACELVDGVFIAARKDVLSRDAVEFDERFKFHFYDMDFCRKASSKGVTIGTWPIAVTHQSEGAFGSVTWWNGYRKYIAKWGS